MKTTKKFEAHLCNKLILVLYRPNNTYDKTLEHRKMVVFPHTGPKVSHSRPAPKRKYGIFGLDVRKNSIRSTGVKLVSPQLVFATLAFGSSVNLYELWTVQVFSSLGT